MTDDNRSRANGHENADYPTDQKFLPSEYSERGYRSYCDKDYASALKYLKMAEAAGDNTRASCLGHIYYIGLSTDKDYARAYKYYSLPESQNDRVALNNLGCMYLEGECVPKNYDKSEACLKKAADMGLTTALSNLGILYYRTEKYREAVKYFDQAIEGGDNTVKSLRQKAFDLGLKESDETLKKNAEMLDKVRALKKQETAARTNPGASSDDICTKAGNLFEAKDYAGYIALMEPVIENLSITDTLKSLQYLMLCRSYRNQNMPEKALRAGEKSIMLNPKNFTPYLDIALAADMLKDYRKTAFCYKKWLDNSDSSDSRYALTQFLYAAALFDLGQLQQALTMLDLAEMNGYDPNAIADMRRNWSKNN